jgi:DNA-binding NtrC family response regulator
MNDVLAILSIEDSAADFLLIELALQQSGLSYRCQRVDSKEALLAALADEHWDLVLSDYSVPGLYFPEILGYLKKRWPALPVILVSGTLGEEKAAVMVKLGAQAFISKYNLAELLPTIWPHLQRQDPTAALIAANVR